MAGMAGYTAAARSIKPSGVRTAKFAAFLSRPSSYMALLMACPFFSALGSMLRRTMRCDQALRPILRAVDGGVGAWFPSRRSARAGFGTAPSEIRRPVGTSPPPVARLVYYHHIVYPSQAEPKPGPSRVKPSPNRVKPEP